MKNHLISPFFILLILSWIFSGCNKVKESGRLPSAATANYVEVSPDNPAYFQLSDGTPYIPIGINMINPNYPVYSTDSALNEIETWMKNLSENGGNYVRVWLSQSFWDMEDEKAGVYDPEKVQRIDRFVAMARKYGLRIKMTMEHFRGITEEEVSRDWVRKPIYHTSHGGPLNDIGEYLSTEAGRKLFLDKLDFYQAHFGSDTVFFGWELWNEMNAMRGPEDSTFFAWNKMMLQKTKARFPENLVMQSFGSFDRESVRNSYRRMVTMPENDVAQIHRYLDPGADMPVCQAPMDIIASSAIDELLSYNLDKPALLAETGAVEPNHSGPSHLYKKDTAGILLHDVLFAPFFSGAAGAGMIWHWNQYVHPNNLWYHYGRFAEAIKGINPLKEKFTPVKIETDSFRIYVLGGITTTLVWIRDKNDTWQRELDDNLTPGLIRNSTLSLDNLNIEHPINNIRIYDPWKNIWSEKEAKDDIILLPDFKRSLVVRIE